MCIFIKTILVNTETLVKRAQCLEVTPEIKVAALFNRKGSLVDAQGGAHQHGITIHNQVVMRERESGVIEFITKGLGEGGYLGEEVHPLCFLSPSVLNLIN